MRIIMNLIYLDILIYTMATAMNVIVMVGEMSKMWKR